MSIQTQRNSLPLLCLNFKVPSYPDYYFRDDFDDDIRDPLWTDIRHNGTITEAGGLLTLAIAETEDGDWWVGIDNAPIAIISPTANALTITTKLNEYTVNVSTNAGLIIGNTLSIPDNAGTYCYSWMRARTEGGINGLEVINLGVAGSQAVNNVTTPPVWLRIRATAQSAPNTIYFDYSTDGINWINIHSITNFNWTFVGLHAKNWAHPGPEISAPFEFFQLENLTEQECLAPIDTRAPNVFYEGRIKQMASLKRAVDDKTGLFQIADMSITLANEDKHYSQKMASYILKNQEATLYHAWTDERDADKIEIIKLIVEDHSMKGPDFIIKFKDITQKYFTKKVPENICTKDDFPWIHPDHEGRCMPEILGNASLLGDYEYQGAVEAVYVNTTGPTFWCLASAGIITIPTGEVWIGTDQKTEGGEYNVVYESGHTYIQFLAGHDPGEKTVTFNAHGYTVPLWDSANGYIQNLAYIIQYFLRFIMELPAELVNSPSFTTLASYYEEMGVDENCYLILQDRVDAMEVLRQLLFTGGAKGFMAMDGEFNVQRKNICNWEIDSTDYHIFEQIELFDSAHRQWNLTSAVNTVNVEYGFIPWQNLYTGAKSEYRDNRFERDMEDDIRRDRRRE